MAIDGSQKTRESPELMCYGATKEDALAKLRELLRTEDHRRHKQGHGTQREEFTAIIYENSKKF